MPHKHQSRASVALGKARPLFGKCGAPYCEKEEKDQKGTSGIVTRKTGATIGNRPHPME